MLKTAMIFGNNMVIQRQKNFKIWGIGTPGNIKGVLKGSKVCKAEGIIEESGEWILTFPAMEAERNLELTITDNKDSIIYQNISIGEVWLAGGQSNMEYFLQFDALKEQVLNDKMNPDIRFFDYPEISYEEQLIEHDYSRFGIWRTCTKNDLSYFSAVGYYFAKNLQEKLSVPIGIVGCNWGGTPACSWIDPEFLKDNEGREWLDSYNRANLNLNIEEYMKNFRKNPDNDHSNPLDNEIICKLMYPGFSKEEQKAFMENMSAEQINPLSAITGPYSEKRPGGLYDTMLKKAAPFSIRGIIWYQGESDSEKPYLYGTVFNKLIACWRNLWNDENLPFLFVQLAPFEKWLGCTGDMFPIIRSQQELVSDTVSNTWMASSSDAGMRWDIHPKNKKSIGTRLALLARGHIYNENILCDPPEFLNAERVPDGIKINLQYAEGLHIKGNQINAFIIETEDGKELTPDEILIHEDSILIMGCFADKVMISFAKTPFYEVNIYNKEENPLKPFSFTI